MNDNQILIDLGIRLGESAVRNSSGLIFDKIRKIKESNEDKQTIAQLQDIIDDLINDKSELLQIAQAYRQELVAQQIEDKDIAFIVETVVPVFEKLMSAEADPKKRRQNEETIKTAKELLSKEAIKVMQLIGFNFKQALGQPLTELTSKKITHLVPSQDIQRLTQESVLLTLKVAESPDAYRRYMTLLGRAQEL